MMLRGCSSGKIGNGGGKGQCTIRQTHVWRRRVGWRTISGLILWCQEEQGGSVEIEVPVDG